MSNLEPIPAAFDCAELELLVGRELHVGDIARATCRVVERLRADHVSVLHVACSDGLEQKNGEHFRDMVARQVVHMGDRDWAPLRTANLGARYETGSGAVAASHFGGPGSTIALIALAAHVGVLRNGAEVTFGHYDRGGRHSGTCGALSMLMGGKHAPFLTELAELFGRDGLDRVAQLNDPAVVAPNLRGLFAAVVQARLQARRALLDSAAERVLISATVTLNQRGPDHEILVGFYAGQRDAAGTMTATWYGLGDHPANYQTDSASTGITISQPGPIRRQARCHETHRSAPLELFTQRQVQAAQKTESPASGQPTPAALTALNQLDDLLNDPKHPWTSLAVKASALALGEALAVPALLALFAGGALHVHHNVRLARLAQTGTRADPDYAALINAAASDLATRPIAQGRAILRAAHDRLVS